MKILCNVRITCVLRFPLNYTNIAKFSRARFSYDMNKLIDDTDKLVRRNELGEKARTMKVFPMIRVFHDRRPLPWHSREFRSLFVYFCHLELVR